MAHSNTQFDRQQIIGVANQHSDMAQNISQQLVTMHGQVTQTAASASSQMTTALEQVVTSWQQQVNKVVLDNLSLMAEAMKREAENQEIQDTDNTRAITNTVSPVGSFLAG